MGPVTGWENEGYLRFKSVHHTNGFNTDTETMLFR